MKEREHSRREVLKTGAVAVMAGLAGCGGGGGSPTPTSTPTPTPTREGSIDVEDQVVEDHVLVTNVTVDKPGWVIVWPEAEDGGPKLAKDEDDSAIARRHVDGGTTDEVEAEPGRFDPPLSEQIDGEQTWYIVLHYDDPRNQQFTYPKGDEPVEISGEMISESFTATPPDADGDD